MQQLTVSDAADVWSCGCHNLEQNQDHNVNKLFELLLFLSCVMLFVMFFHISMFHSGLNLCVLCVCFLGGYVETHLCFTHYHKEFFAKCLFSCDLQSLASQPSLTLTISLLKVEHAGCDEQAFLL